MRLTEINRPTKQAIIENLLQDKEHTFTPEVVETIAESVSNFDHKQRSMSVSEAIEWLKNA